MVKKINKFSPFHYYYDDPGYTFGYGKGGWGDVSNPLVPFANFRIIDPSDPSRTIPYLGGTVKGDQGIFVDEDLKSEVSDQLPKFLIPPESLQTPDGNLGFSFDPDKKTDITSRSPFNIMLDPSAFTSPEWGGEIPSGERLTGKSTSTIPPSLGSPRFVEQLKATPLNIETDQTDKGITANDQMPSGPLYFSRGYGERGTPTTMREKVTDFFTAPFRESFDIAQVKAPGSALGGLARFLMPLVTSPIPGAGLMSLVPRIFGGDTQPTFYETEGVPVDRIAIGPNMTWLGGNIAGGGQYVPNTQLDMAALGDAPTGAMGELVNGEFVPNPDSWYQGRPLTVIDQQSEGYREIPSTYRIDPFGAASITSDDFGAPGVDYGDIYYGGADYEGLDTGEFDDIFSGEEDWF